MNRTAVVKQKGGETHSKGLQVGTKARIFPPVQIRLRTEHVFKGLAELILATHKVKIQ